MLSKVNKIIVTGGPTREWFDPIRYISNASSGKMGIALADEAFKLNTSTVFIHGPISEHLLHGKAYKMVSIESTEDLLNAVLSELEDNSVLIMAAAPADYTPVNKSAQKIKKTEGELVITMKKTPDILKNVAQYKKSRGFKNLFVVGFAAETNDTENYAKGKLQQKDLDMICLNDVSQSGAGFNVDTNIMTIFTRSGEKFDLPMKSKNEIARDILERVSIELTKRG